MQAAAQGAAQAGKAGRAPAEKVSGALRGFAVVVIGAVATGGIAAATLAADQIGSASLSSRSPTGTAEPTLSALPAGEIAAATATLDPAASQRALADAKSCKAPIAWVILAKQGGGPDGMVRIRSGSYLSPPFHVTSTPQRVAVPYPAPYPTGHGVLSVVGQADALAIAINPVWRIQRLDGAASLSVRWAPTNPC